MKSILGISIVLHMAAFSVAAKIGSRQGMISVVSAADHAVIEMRLGAAPRPPQAARTTATKIPKTAAPLSAPLPEIPSPMIEQLASEILPPALPGVATGTGKICSDCAPAPSVATTGKPGSAASAGNAATGDAVAKADELPWAVFSPPPEYPREARRKGWSGRVGVHVLIAEKGTVQQTEIASSSGHAELDEAAMAALRKWIFHPAEKDGHAIAAWVVVPVLFRLD